MVETHLISQGIALFCKGVFKRPRPYVYDPAIPLSKRFDRDASRSFFSSHATAAFNNAVMAGFLCDAARLPSKQKQFILAGGMTLAVSTGLLRVLSGRHFPTDVLAGAAVGWITASLIQPLHR